MKNSIPNSPTLRGDMYEETVRFFEDMFRNDGSILGLLDANHTFLNESLAQHYGIDGVRGNQWRRVDGVREHGRGGVLGMATFLASQSGASRTSPILRGNWVYETLLGERLPRPPADVPQLPDEVPSGLTARQVDRASQLRAGVCQVPCEDRSVWICPGAVRRDRPNACRRRWIPRRSSMDGKEIEGIDGLRDYLANDRRERRRATVLSQAARLFAGPRIAALGRAAD